MARGDSHGTRVWHPEHFDADVRAQGNTWPLGTATVIAAADSVGDRRLHRVRAAGLCAPEHTFVPAGTGARGTTLAEHLKIHALARILLAGSIHNIQVSWVKLDRKLSQLCLHAGANDYGG